MEKEKSGCSERKILKAKEKVPKIQEASIIPIYLDPQVKHRGWPDCNRVGWDWKILCK